jgi:hypothetical protein
MFVTMKTATTVSDRPSASSPTSSPVSRPSAMRPPASGNTAHVTTLLSPRSHVRRERIASISDAEAPMAAAGAGPSSTMASTMARKDPETRTPRNSTVSTSLTTASENSSRTSVRGCQSPASDVRTPTATATTSAAAWAARMSPLRLDTALS